VCHNILICFAFQQEIIDNGEWYQGTFESNGEINYRQRRSIHRSNNGRHRAAMDSDQLTINGISYFMCKIL